MSAPSDRDFDSVVEGSRVPHACTPRLGAERGIRLAAPRVTWFGPGARPSRRGAFARLVVACAYHFDAGYLGLRGSFLPHLLFVAVDAATHEAFAGTADIPSRRRSPGSRIAHPGRSILEYDHPNLASALRLPEREASYLVYAALGAHVSNVVQVQLRRTPEGGK